MCLNSGGNDKGQIFFQKFFRRGENDKRGNDRGYYGNIKYKYLLYIIFFNILY